MISAAMMRKQVGRMLRLPYAPLDPADLKGLADEFARVLHSVCDVDAHCAAVVDAVIDSTDRVPAPATIRSVAATIPAPNHKGPQTECSICDGSGWQSFVRSVTIPAVGSYMADFADFCPCARGQWMRDCEKKRKEEAAAKAKKFA